ncbi:P1 family peptidase [bacterium]|nr:P1 family peptidase [bacterium]
MDQKEIRKRARALGIEIGRLTPGEYNAITDVPGIRVGHSTIKKGESEKGKVSGVARTGVTVIVPHETIWHQPIFAGSHVINGNGEMTGTSWLGESGLLTTPIAITNTNSVGIARDALVAYYFEQFPDDAPKWLLPVVAETWDGILSDPKGMFLQKEDVINALESAKSGYVEEGSVGGGTGMICHEFKGGIGTSSRKLSLKGQNFHVGSLVQANYGLRYQLQIDGVPVGKELPVETISGIGQFYNSESAIAKERGSIIIVTATDIPLLPSQCERLARRTSAGLARMGSIYGNDSGDIAIAFSTGNMIMSNDAFHNITCLGNDVISDVFEAVVESTEEAILNALCSAETLSGIDGRTVHAMPVDEVKKILKTYNR